MKPIFIGREVSETGRRLLLDDERLETHVHCIGASRTGKSKMAELLARAIIRRDIGVCVIDPHGSLYDPLVRWLAYFEPKREVILFNPPRTDRIVGFNPFRRMDGDPSARVERRVQLFLKAWGEGASDTRPRLERGLRCINRVLVEKGYSIEMARYLISWTHHEIRDLLVQGLSSELIADEWVELEGSDKRGKEFREQLESTKSRLFRFLDSRLIRRVMGLDTNTIDFEDIIQNGKVLLVNLQPSDALSSESARLIGTLLLNEIWEVTRRRAKQTGARRPRPYFVVLDEFQRFLTPDIDEMLNEAAGFGLHLMLFHQHLSQLREEDPKAYASVMTNARTKIVFGGLMRPDARTIAEEIFPGQIDLKEVKFLLEQTQFWPVYTREKIYSSGRSSTLGGVDVTGAASGLTTGMAWDPSSESWIDTSGSSAGVTSSHADSWAEALTEGVTDVPFLYPMPVEVVTNVEHFKLEEQIWKLSDALMEQYQRYFFLRRPGFATVAGVTPYVKDWYVTPDRLDGYVASLVSRFLTAPEVDAAIEDMHRRLALDAGIAPRLLDGPQYD